MSDTEVSREQIATALREVIDPEVGINILDLGLVYRVEVDLPRVTVQMTMTTPACPLGPYLTTQVQDALGRLLPAASDIQVDVVWEPAWSPDFISDEGRRQLGWARRAPA
jgi:metal-sulfur cluster biosynthetic enzyme